MSLTAWRFMYVWVWEQEMNIFRYCVSCFYMIEKGIKSINPTNNYPVFLIITSWASSSFLSFPLSSTATASSSSKSGAMNRSLNWIAPCGNELLRYNITTQNKEFFFYVTVTSNKKKIFWVPEISNSTKFFLNAWEWLKFI